MSFVSLTFLVFLPVVFVLHWAVGRRVWQNAVLLAASYFFYGWWDWRFLGLLVVTSLVDYGTARGLERVARPGVRRCLLGVSLAANLGMLGFFKYFNFFVDSLVIALSTAGIDVNTSTLRVVLPVGISFYTFQTMSYVVDVYRGQLEARRDLLSYLTYVAFFPQLVAGPIERAPHLLPQFERVRVFDGAGARSGLRLMLWGFAKKMVLADTLAPWVDEVYGVPGGAGGAALGLATVAFAFQIYGDFSGYSDIAAGAARCFGVTLVRNFDCPYLAQSLTEFWRRWHISLTTWFRDYVYIPLGGNRQGESRTLRNLVLTTVISGLWHGAAWHFVLWGVFHGGVLALERVTGVRFQADRSRGVAGGEGWLPRPRVLGRMAVTFGLVCAGWVLFRASSVEDAWVIYGKLWGLVVQPSGWLELGGVVRQRAFPVLLMVVFVVVEWCNRAGWVPRWFESRSGVVRWSVYAVTCWVILLLGTQRTASFIYFQF